MKIGVIGTGKFSSMFLSQARLTPGMQVVGIAELDPDKAIQALARTGWDEKIAVSSTTASSINKTAGHGKIAKSPVIRKSAPSAP